MQDPPQHVCISVSLNSRSLDRTVLIITYSQNVCHTEFEVYLTKCYMKSRYVSRGFYILKNEYFYFQKLMLIITFPLEHILT